MECLAPKEAGNPVMELFSVCEPHFPLPNIIHALKEKGKFIDWMFENQCR